MILVLLTVVAVCYSVWVHSCRWRPELLVAEAIVVPGDDAPPIEIAVMQQHCCGPLGEHPCPRTGFYKTDISTVTKVPVLTRESLELSDLISSLVEIFRNRLIFFFVLSVLLLCCTSTAVAVAVAVEIRVSSFYNRSWEEGRTQRC